jgi:hypothetical protein
MAEVKDQQFVLNVTRGPVVRFSGCRLSSASEKGSRWAIYRTVGGNYILEISNGYTKEVKDYKNSKLLVSYLKMVGRRERESTKGPRDWSPRADYGVSEAQAKMILDAGEEVSKWLVRDVK